jgi:glycosyltransferase involved in cell wall biosynthesis
MIGGGPLEPKVRERAAALGLQDDVVLTGQVDNPYPLIMACTHGLLTSRREGFPNVLLEMMAVGISRIVTTPCSGDLQTLTGVAIVRPDPAELASAIATEDDLCAPIGAYATALRRRTPAAFLAAVLGEGPDAAAPRFECDETQAAALAQAHG